MRLLWLGASEIESAEIPPDELAPNVAAARISQRCDAEVEVVARKIWPDENMVAAVSGWVERLEPDLIYIWVSSYPACYASVPIRLAKAWGRFGQTIGRIGVSAAGEGWAPRTPLFRAARWLARRSVGASARFEPEDVARRYESLLHAIVQQEHVGLVVAQSPRPLYVDWGRAVADARWRRQHEAIAASCRRLHIPCLDADAGIEDGEILALRGPDRLHFNVAGHAAYGAAAGDALAALWQAAGGSAAPAGEPIRS